MTAEGEIPGVVEEMAEGEEAAETVEVEVEMAADKCDREHRSDGYCRRECSIDG